MNTAFCRRWSWMMVVAAVTLATFATPALYAQPGSDGELKNVAVIAGAPYEKLMSDITFLGSLAGKPEVGQMIEGGLSFFTQGKGTSAIDKKQAWGVIVQTDGDNFLPVGCLPVTKPDDLLDVAKGFGAEIKDVENGGGLGAVLPGCAHRGHPGQAGHAQETCSDQKVALLHLHARHLGPSAGRWQATVKADAVSPRELLDYILPTQQAALGCRGNLRRQMF